MQAAGGASGAVAVGGARGVGWGVASAAGTRHPPAPPAAAHPRVCGGTAAASRQNKVTALHIAAYYGHAPCAESLIKAGADASLKDMVSDGTEGRGGRRGGGSGRRGRGGGLWGEGACSQAPRRLSAPRSHRPLPPGAAASTSSLPPPRRRKARRRWTAPRGGSARRSSRSWRTPPPSQRRSAAPRRTPPPRRPAPAPCATVRGAASLAVASHSALAPYHLITVARARRTSK